jgi:hypothetical protein
MKPPSNAKLWLWSIVATFTFIQQPRIVGGQEGGGGGGFSELFLATLRLLLTVEGVAQRNETELLRRAECVLKFQALQFDFQRFDRYNEFFHNDSSITLAQAGVYVGVDAMSEYVGFTSGERSPYVAAGPLNTTLAMRIAQVTGQVCDFTVSAVSGYILDPATTGRSDQFKVLYMARIFFDWKEGYVKKVNVFFSTGFLEYFMGGVLASCNTKRFVCDQVLGTKCAGIIPPPPPPPAAAGKDYCLARLKALPATEGPSVYFDGNSTGCRALHAAFAVENPVHHCAHVSLDRVADPQGQFKCGKSAHRKIGGLFTPADLKFHQTFAETNGLDVKFVYCCNPGIKTRPRLSRSAGDDSSAAKSAHRKKIGRLALYPGRFDVSPDLCRKRMA